MPFLEDAFVGSASSETADFTTVVEASSNTQGLAASPVICCGRGSVLRYGRYLSAVQAGIQSVVQDGSRAVAHSLWGA